MRGFHVASFVFSSIVHRLKLCRMFVVLCFFISTGLVLSLLAEALFLVFADGRKENTVSEHPLDRDENRAIVVFSREF